MVLTLMRGAENWNRLRTRGSQYTLARCHLDAGAERLAHTPVGGMCMTDRLLRGAVSRRSFIASLVGTLSAIPLLQACSSPTPPAAAPAATTAPAAAAKPTTAPAAAATTAPAPTAAPAAAAKP